MSYVVKSEINKKKILYNKLNNLKQYINIIF